MCKYRRVSFLGAIISCIYRRGTESHHTPHQTHTTFTCEQLDKLNGNRKKQQLTKVTLVVCISKIGDDNVVFSLLRQTRETLQGPTFGHCVAFTLFRPPYFLCPLSCPPGSHKRPLLRLSALSHPREVRMQQSGGGRRRRSKPAEQRTEIYLCECTVG